MQLYNGHILFSGTIFDHDLWGASLHREGAAVAAAAAAAAATTTASAATGANAGTGTTYHQTEGEGGASAAKRDVNRPRRHARWVRLRLRTATGMHDLVARIPLTHVDIRLVRLFRP